MRQRMITFYLVLDKENERERNIKCYLVLKKEGDREKEGSNGIWCKKKMVGEKY